LQDIRRSVELTPSPEHGSVTHFESPPRRRLREDEDRALAEIEGKSNIRIRNLTF
jgi:hypothetical protein